MSVITNEGMGIVAGLMTSDVGETAFDYVGIGTGTTAENASDVWLETIDQCVAATGTRITTAQTNDTMQLVVDAFTFGGAKAITESIVSTAATDTGTVLLCRDVFTAVNVTAADELKVTWTVQVKQGA